MSAQHDFWKPKPYDFEAIAREVDFRLPGQRLAAYQFRAGDDDHVKRDPEQPQEWWENVIRFHDERDEAYFGTRGNNKLEDVWDNRRKVAAK